MKYTKLIMISICAVLISCKKQENVYDYSNPSSITCLNDVIYESEDTIKTLSSCNKIESEWIGQLVSTSEEQQDVADNWNVYYKRYQGFEKKYTRTLCYYYGQLKYDRISNGW